ncbi:MAG TPA: hypothetical protein VLJ44_06050, partial [Gaiellaceae bacterium]|nr:hypothetical protein [Gaiellaceae bacterium]
MGATGATRGCDRAKAGEEDVRGEAIGRAAWTTGTAELGGSATCGRGRTTRVSCAGAAAGTRTGSAERTLSPPAVVADGGSATAAPDGGLWSGTAAAGLGSAAGTEAVTAVGGAAGTLGAAGAATGGATGGAAGAGAGATGAATGAAGTAPRAGRTESGSRYPCASAAIRTP